MSGKNKFAPDHVLPPGETIREILSDLDLSQADLSSRLGCSEQLVNDLIEGKAPLSEEIAFRLERTFGIVADFWMGLEADYRLFQARQKEEGVTPCPK